MADVSAGVGPEMGGHSRVRALRRRRAANVPGGRNQSFRVRVSDEEALALHGLAAARNVTVPRLLLESALAGLSDRDGVLTRAEKDELLAAIGPLRRDVEGVGVNVNQMAHHMNATTEMSSEWLSVGTSARGVLDAVSAVLKRFV